MKTKLVLVVGLMMTIAISILAVEIQVNTDQTGDQSSPDVAIDGNNIVTIVWASNPDGIFARRFTADGTPLGDQFQVSAYFGHWYHTNPKVIARNDGGFTVVWPGSGPDDDFGIYGRIFDAAGVAIGPEFLINTTTADWQNNPSIAGTPDDESIVVWDSDAIYAGGEILLQRLGSDGLPIGTEFQIAHGNETSGDLNYGVLNPVVDSDSEGRYLIVWNDGSNTPSGAESGFSGLLHENDGSVVTSIDESCPDYRDKCRWVDASMDDAGFVVTWFQYKYQSTTEHIKARLFDTVGDVIIPEEEVFATNGYFFSPTVSKSDGFVVSWTYGYQIHARSFDAQGVAHGDAVNIQEDWFSDGGSPALEHKADDELVYVWSDWDDHGRGIWASFEGCFDISVAIDPPGAGEVTITNPHNCPNAYFGNTVLELVAQPEPGQVFSHWIADSGGFFVNSHGQPGEFTITGGAAVTASFVPEGSQSDIPLADGQSTDSEIAAGWDYYVFDVPDCADEWTVLVYDVTELEPGNPDVDLYLRHGSAPTLAEYDFRAVTAENGESIRIEDPQTGVWWIGVTPSPAATAAASYTINTRNEGCDGDGLISWWAGEGNADDSAGPNDGAPQGGLQYSPGWTGTAFDFDGIDGSVQIPDDSSLDIGTGDFTLSFWIRSTDDVGVVAIQDKRTPTTGYHAFLWHGRVGVQISDGTFSDNYVAERDIADGELHHVAITVGRTTSNGGRIFIDGRSELVFNASVSPGSLSNSEAFMIGQRCAATGDDAFIEAVIDEIRIYDRALPIREAGDPIGGLKSWWQAEENTHDRQGLAFLTAHDITYLHGTGKVGESFGMNGTTSYAMGPGQAPQEGDFSVVFWVRATTYSGVRTILDSHGGDPSRGIFVFLEDGQPGITLSDGSGSSTFVAPFFVASPSYRRVAITVDRDSATGGRFIIDRVPRFIFDATARQGSLFEPGGQIAIGRRTDEAGAGEHFHGYLDEIMLYDKALTDHELAYLVGPPWHLVFSDDFSTGDTTMWSSTVP